MRLAFCALLILASACGDARVEDNGVGAEDGNLHARQNEADSAVTARTDLPPLSPPAPGEPGGLPDDRTPVSEAPSASTTAQGAAQVLQTYFGLLEQGRYAEAWRLWSDTGRASGMSQGAFADSFDRYGEYHANIGAPGRVEGAAGSLYVEVPVQVYGRLKDGTPFDMLGSVTLRRVNDVPGSTAEQREWHIASSTLEHRS